MTEKTPEERMIIDQWLSLPSLEESLPYEFPDRVKLRSLEICCPKCHGEIDPARHRGEVTKLAAFAVLIDAFAFCRYCHLVYPTTYRAQSTDQGLILEEKIGDDWVECEVENLPLTLWRRIKRWWYARS